MMPDGLYRMTPLEVASGWITGSEGPAVSERPDDVEGEHPLSALEKILRQALQRPPCVISFSGGRDSSALVFLLISCIGRILPKSDSIAAVRLGMSNFSPHSAKLETKDGARYG